MISGNLERAQTDDKRRKMDPIRLSESTLLVVDPQQGFTSLCPSELPVPGGLEIVGAVNRLLDLPWGRVDASQDWHPPDHCSFFGQRDNLYPPHCIAGTPGAEFLPGLHTERFQTIWRKGFERDFEAYALTAQHPGFSVLLRKSGISTVIVCGIATNICCFYAARDLPLPRLKAVMWEDSSGVIDLSAATLSQAE